MSRIGSVLAVSKLDFSTKNVFKILFMPKTFEKAVSLKIRQLNFVKFIKKTYHDSASRAILQISIIQETGKYSSELLIFIKTQSIPSIIEFVMSIASPLEKFHCYWKLFWILDTTYLVGCHEISCVESQTFQNYEYLLLTPNKIE